MDFFGIKKKLEEGFGSLTGNIGNLFNQGARTVGGVANNVLQQARPAAQQASQQWSNLQSTGNTLRQQAQSLTNNAINATTRDIASFDLADSISSRAQDLGYSKKDQFGDVNKLQSGDLSALANPLLKAGNQGLDFQKGINQAPWQVAANLPRAAAATNTLVNMAQEPVNRMLLGDDRARAIREQQDLSVKGLYSAGDEVSKFGTNLPWTKQSDPDSAVSKGGKIVGDIGLSIVGGAPSKAVSIPYYLTQAQGRVAGDVQKKTGDLNKAAIAGSVYAPVETALERFSVGKVLDGGGNLASRFARGYVSEGSTEAAQQFAENLTKNKIADSRQSLKEGVLESGIVGGLIGGGVSGLNSGSNKVGGTEFTQQLDKELEGLNSAIMPPAQAPSSLNEQTQVNPPEQVNTQPQVQVPQVTQTPQVPVAPQAPQVPVQQPQVTQPMGEADTQQLQNTQANITREQPLSGQPESIAQLLQNRQIPQQNVANQQALGEAKVQAQDIATLYKMDPATAQRLIEDYGYANVAALAQEVSKSGTARSVDAVVVSEAVKRWGKPRSQMSDAELASLDQTPEGQIAQPTQTTPAEQQPVMDAEAQAYVANQLPEGKVTDTSTGEVLNREGIVAKAAQKVDEVINNKIAPSFDSQPFTIEEFTQQVQEAERNGTNPSPEVAAFYDKNFAPLLKAMAKNIGREDVLQKRWYLPQFREGSLEQLDVGGSLVNKIDVEDFGFSKSREDAIPLNELDYSLEGIRRLAVQEAAYKARYQIRGAEIQAQAQSEGNIISNQKAETLAKSEEALGKVINNAAQKGGIVDSGLQKLDLAEEIGKIGTEKGRPKVELQKEIGQGSYLFSSTPELLDKTNYPGTNQSILDRNGFNRYTEAEGLGHAMVQETNGVDIAAYLNDRYSSVNVSDQVKQNVVEQTIRSLDRLDNNTLSLENKLKQANSLKSEISKLSILKQRQINKTIADLEQRLQIAQSEEYKNEQKAQVFNRAEVAIAREQMNDFLETTDLKGTNLRKVINQEAKRMLVESKAKQAISTKITNGLLGVTYQAGLGWNVMSAMQNVTEIKRAYAEFDTKEFAYGIEQAAKDPGITIRYGVTPTKFGDVLETRGQITKSDHKILRKLKPMAMFYSTETLKDRIMLHAFEYRHQQAGLTGEALAKAVRSDFDKLAIKAGQRGTLGFNKSDTGRLMMQFLQYPIKDLRITGRKIANAAKVGENLTAHDVHMARKFIAKKALSDILLYLLMNAAIGSTWEYISGLQNPFESRIPLDKDASNVEKGIAAIPGGMVLSPFKELYLNMREEARKQQEKGLSPDNWGILGEQATKQAQKSYVNFIPGGNQFIRKTGGFIQDQQRGYNESKDGRARFAATDNPLEQARGAIFGRYTTNNAREYFGSTIGSDLPVIGGQIADKLGAKRFYPVGDRYQDMINKGSDPKTIIIRSREYDQKKQDFKEQNPSQQNTLNDINKTVYNPQTGKNESDVITPEKWDKVNSDSSLKLYDRLKQKAIDDNREFGYAIDPIYKLTDREQIKEVLKIRSLPTGDDTELKQINKAKNQWYRNFAEAETAYYKEIKAKGFEANEEYGPTKRKQEYIDTGSQYPQMSPLVNQYFDIKNKDANAGKEFYKNNRDQLAADFDANKKAAFEWTNNRRRIEGAQPIPWDVFQNVTFGYEDDESKVFKELGFKLGEFGSGGSSKGYNAYKKAKSFSQPTIRIAAPKPGALKIPALKAKKQSYKVPKIIVKTSKA